MKTNVDVRARDLMQTKVITLPESASIAEAIETIEDNHVSGVPVVNAAGQVVGMLSASDIARREHVGESRLADKPGEYDLANPTGDADEEELVEDEEFSSKEDYSPDVLGRVTVADWMNPAVIAVAPDATLKAICELMAREEIHRVLVIERRRLAGIISTLDIVRHLAETL